MIIIKADWKDQKEAKHAQVDGKIVDKHTFKFEDFKGKEVKAGDKDKLTTYLVKRAVELGAVEVKK